MEIRSADRAGSYLDDGIAWMLDFGVRYRIATHVALAVKTQSSHRQISCCEILIKSSSRLIDRRVAVPVDEQDGKIRYAKAISVRYVTKICITNIFPIRLIARRCKHNRLAALVSIPGADGSAAGLRQHRQAHVFARTGNKLSESYFIIFYYNLIKCSGSRCDIRRHQLRCDRWRTVESKPGVPWMAEDFWVAELMIAIRRSNFLRFRWIICEGDWFRKSALPCLQP